MIKYEGLAPTVRQLLGYRLSTTQDEAFSWYAKELTRWNERFNLTAITDPAEIEIKHFLDSLSVIKHPTFRPPGRIVDVGTGAGFPGIPIKIFFPTFDLTLVESVGKKAQFCRHVIKSLGLQGVQVIHDRAENIGQSADHRETYDWGIARAVAIAPVVLEYILPLIRVGGSVILQKGETGLAELHQSEKALGVLGAEVDRVHKVELPGVVEPRFLLVIRKVGATPKQYPRRPGIAAKRPLNTN